MNCAGLYRHVPPSCLKVHGWVCGLQDFSVSPSPLGPNWVFELGWTGLGIRFGDMAWQYGIFVFLEWFNCQGNSGLSISIVSLQSDSKDSILVLWSTQYRPYLRVSWTFPGVIRLWERTLSLTTYFWQSCWDLSAFHSWCPPSWGSEKGLTDSTMMLTTFFLCHVHFWTCSW